MKKLSPKEQAEFDRLMWRVKHDRFSRDQFERIRASAGYLCESGSHETRLATMRRPPMPEKRSKHAVFFCAECWRRLPSKQ